MNNAIKIFQGEELDEQTVYDIVEKSNCISDATESTLKTVLLLEELEAKITESNEKFALFNKNGMSLKSPQVNAIIKGYSKNIILYSRRLEIECKIYSETIGEGIFAYEQAVILHFHLTKDIVNLKSSLQSILGVPSAADQAIDGIKVMRNGINNLPNSILPLKIAKSAMLPILDMMKNEYYTSKTMILDLINKIEKEITNNF